MANYTVTLRDILKDEHAKAEIDRALSTYPLYEKKSLEEFIPCYIPTREELNTKLLNHFKYREIGFDTVGRFIDELEIAMVEIMPRYNLLFHSIDQDFDIKFNVDYTRTTDTDKTGNNTNKVESESSSSSVLSNESTTTSESNTTDTISGNETSNNRDVTTSTPQNTLNLPLNAEGQSYADEVKWNDTNSDTSSSSTAINTGEATATASGSNTSSGNSVVEENGNTSEKELITERTNGNFGVVSAQDLIMKYRESIINVEQMIMYDPRIQELFMLIY